MSRTDAVPVQCVDKTVASDQLGMTLFHEHIFTDNRARAPQPEASDERAWDVWTAPMDAQLAAHLRANPMACLDNCVLEHTDAAIEELGYLVRAGGRTLVEQTPIGGGRQLSALVDVAAATGLNIVAGTGFYMEIMHPPELAGLSVDEIAERMVADLTDGHDGVICGLIGEIGISAEFTAAEERVLRAAGRAQIGTGVPVSVHLPGWHRWGHRVLDCLAEEGVPASSVVLSHMNPSVDDHAYQLSLAERGAFLSFDMVGIDWYFSHTGFQAPSDVEVAAAVHQIWAAGYGAQILLSGDTFLKIQLHQYGGPGYDHVPVRFLPRLERLGMDADAVRALLTRNPGSVFESAARNYRAGPARVRGGRAAG